MNWSIVERIEGFDDYSYHHWIKGIRNGYLVYFSKSDGICIRRSDSLKLIYQNSDVINRNLSYYFFENELFFRIDNKLLRFDFFGLKLIDVCETKEEYIAMINQNYCMGRTSSRRPRINRAEIIKVSKGHVVFNWEDRSLPVYSEKSGLVIFENTFESILKGVDVEAKKVLWELPLHGHSTPRFYNSVDNDLFLVIQRFEGEEQYQLWGINKSTGVILFKSSGEYFKSYNFDEGIKMLVGIEGSYYQSVDPFSGKILKNKQISINEGENNFWANLGRQSLNENKIFYSISGKSKIGCFNLDTENNDYYIDIEVDESKVDMSMPLETPVVNEGFLFVRDNSGVLHVLKQNYPPVRLRL
ncbi:hypothetical protein DSECCO2_472720 [anaerobic digester metagenome]